MRQVEDQKAELDRIMLENEEEKAVLESSLDETFQELAGLKHGQSETSTALQQRIDAMTTSHKRKMQQILGKKDDGWHTRISVVEAWPFTNRTLFLNFWCF